MRPLTHSYWPQVRLGRAREPVSHLTDVRVCQYGDENLLCSGEGSSGADLERNERGIFYLSSSTPWDLVGGGREAIALSVESVTMVVA